VRGGLRERHHACLAGHELLEHDPSMRAYPGRPWPIDGTPGHDRRNWADPFIRERNGPLSVILGFP
jgi:hypothetical protein